MPERKNSEKKELEVTLAQNQTTTQPRPDTRPAIGLCEHCGVGFKTGEAKCPSCGAKLPLLKKPSEEKPVEENETNKNYIIKNRPTSYIVKIAMLGALAFLISLLNFSIFPAYNFLKMDFANIPSLIGGFVLGPVAGVIIEAVKVLLMMLFNGPSFSGIGDLSNFICGAAFVLPCAILYKYKKGIKWVFLGLSVSIIIEIIVSLLSNYLIIIPLYESTFIGFKIPNAYYGFVALFNLIKYTSAAIITFLIYKRISGILHRL